MRNKNKMIGYINAGGRGTRLNGLFEPDPEKGIAKALLSVGSPKTTLIDHHIAQLRKSGIEDIVVASGDQTEVYNYIKDIYGDGENILATRSRLQLGTGGDLIDYIKKYDTDSPIFIQNVDTVLDIDIDDFGRYYTVCRELGARACLAVTTNKGVPNENAFTIDYSGKVICSREFNAETDNILTNGNAFNASSTGAVIVDPDSLRDIKWDRGSEGQYSIYSDYLKTVSDKDALYAYNNGSKFFRDIGTIANWLYSQSDPEFNSNIHY